MLTVLSLVRSALAAQIAAAAPWVRLVEISGEGDLPADVRGEVLLTYPWASKNLSAILARGVRWIHAMGTGIDAFPLPLLTDDHILTCSRGGSAVPIAEWVLAVMLAFEKHLPEAWIHEPPAVWSRGDRGGLWGRSLGLIGFGAIGRAVAQRAVPFGMRVRAYRRTAAASDMAGVEVLRSLPKLVAASDHIVIAAPATAATRHLLNAEILAAMRPGAHLVNIARGALVDQEALRAALDSGHIAMASLDAVEPEPLPPGHWMYVHERVRLSPHISWQMPGAIELLIAPFIDNLRRYEAGQPLTGAVDRQAGY